MTEPEMSEGEFRKLMADDELLNRIKELEAENTELKNNQIVNIVCDEESEGFSYMEMRLDISIDECEKLKTKLIKAEALIAKLTATQPEESEET